MEITGINPHTNCYPMLSDEELDLLAENIKTNGLLDPIIVTESGELIDGRNRLEACKRAGVEPHFSIFEGEPEDIGAFVRSKNERRHQSAGARAMSDALSLAHQGKRKNGRWEYGLFNSQDFGNSWRESMRKAGVILDYCGSDMARSVIDGYTSLDRAYKVALRKRDVDREPVHRAAYEWFLHFNVRPWYAAFLVARCVTLDPNHDTKVSPESFALQASDGHRDSGIDEELVIYYLTGWNNAAKALGIPYSENLDHDARPEWFTEAWKEAHPWTDYAPQEINQGADHE